MGQCTNPLIGFDLIRGLTVGRYRRYGLLTRLSKGRPFDSLTIIKGRAMGLSYASV